MIASDTDSVQNDIFNEALSSIPYICPPYNIVSVCKQVQNGEDMFGSVL